MVKQIKAIAISSLFLLLHGGVISQPAYPGDYYKCVDAKGQMHISNVACQSQSEKMENHQLRDTSEYEYQESRRREEALERMKKANQEAGAQQEKAQKLAEELVRAREECLVEADKRYLTRWDDTCRSNGQSRGCGLNPEIINSYDLTHRGDRNECYQRYPLR